MTTTLAIAEVDLALKSFRFGKNGITSEKLKSILDRIYDLLRGVTEQILYAYMATPYELDGGILPDSVGVIHRNIDIFINYLGLVTIHNFTLLNQYPSLTMHLRFESLLVRVFREYRSLQDLMYGDGGGIPDANPYTLHEYVDRSYYAKGPHWRMTNLIMSGFFRLYNLLLDPAALFFPPPSHFYYFCVLVTSGMDAREDLVGGGGRPNLFIPNIYKWEAAEIIRKLSVAISPNNRTKALSDPQWLRDHHVGPLGPYEYNIFKGEHGEIAQVGGYADEHDQRVVGWKMER